MYIIRKVFISYLNKCRQNTPNEIGQKPNEIGQKPNEIGLNTNPLCLLHEVLHTHADIIMLACQHPPKHTPTMTPPPTMPLAHGTSIYNTQNDLLLHKVLRFYHENGGENMEKMLAVINGTTNISLRIMDWFVTNYSKKHYTVYDLEGSGTPPKRFKVYVDYKLKLRAYSKKRFDPFCRWERINVPHMSGTTYIQTTLGQLNFFKWAIENQVLRYIHENYSVIESDMNIRNNTSRKMAKSHHTSAATVDGCEITVDAAPSTDSQTVIMTKPKNRKKREELSSSATKSIKKEFVDIVITFD